MSDTTQLRIEASHKKISEVFSEKYAFSIPTYQRPYAWQTTQIEELLTDIQEAMGPKSRSDGFYFLGSIVLVKSHDKPESQVVDGQQRLTTLTILFGVIRDLTDDAELQGKREKYIKQVADADEGLPETLRLQLRQQDQAYFEKHVQNRNVTNNLPSIEGIIGSKARIIENTATIRALLVEMGEDQRSELLRFLLQSCYLVVVEVPTPTAARRIFTVLNARGMDLSATDILKANLLEQAGEARELQLSQRWEDIEISLGRDKFNDLFTHIRMIFERDKPRAALEKAFPEQVKIFEEEPLKFVDKVLEPYADALTLSADYQALRNRFGVTTADLVKSLNRLDNKDWLPPLLLCLRQSNEDKREDIAEVVNKLERLAYYLFAIRANVNIRMSRYADVLDFLEPTAFPKPRVKEKNKSAGLNLNDDEAYAFFDALNGPLYLYARVAKPILLRLEQASNDASANYDYPTISIEHVCPQTIDADSEWANWFANPDDHNKWLHRLGNLVLLNFRKNIAARNYKFDTKKSKYFAKGDTCAFTLTNEVRDFHSWTPADIEGRQAELLERLAKTWELEISFVDWKANK